MKPLEFANKTKLTECKRIIAVVIISKLLYNNTEQGMKVKYPAMQPSGNKLHRKARYLFN